MIRRNIRVALAGSLLLAACSDRADSPTAPTAAVAASAEKTWVVAFKGNGLPNDVDKMVTDAGGTIITRIPEIGGIAATSTNPNFGTAIKGSSSVLAADPALETKLIDPSNDVGITSADNNGGNYAPTGSDAQAMPDPLGFEQWDKKKMNATVLGSYAIQQGRRDVVVGVLDTGADGFHPDVAPNLDVARSRSFVPSEPTFQDFNGHGTWCISAVGAPINGIGISGVAPNVTLVSLKVLSGAGRGLFIYTDQALVYAGQNHFDVASMSLGGYIQKRGDKAGGNHTDYILLQRAIQFARSNGVLPVAALGNEGWDVSDGSFFRDFVEAPGEMPGVVGVSATGYNDIKAFYSNFGTGKTDVSAPGGSTRDYRGIPGQPGFCPHGSLCRVIGAWSTTGASSPADPIEVCTGPGGAPPCALYGYVQGTSMATPNAAGVAALIISQYGDFSGGSNKAHMSPTTVEQYLQISANNQPCPEPNTVTQGPGFFFPTATCQGNTGYNNFFGKGIVDALKAVTLH